MKKAISIFLCLIMLLSFSGCDNNKEEKNDKVKYPIIPQSIELPQSKTNYHFYASQNGYFYKIVVLYHFFVVNMTTLYLFTLSHTKYCRATCAQQY